MDKFRVLPTDERFINLYEEQKLALFEGLNSLPDEKILKKNIIIQRKEEEILNKKDEEIMNKKIQERMKENLKSQGMSDADIEANIKNIIAQKKKYEIEKFKGDIKE